MGQHKAQGFPVGRILVNPAGVLYRMLGVQRLNGVFQRVAVSQRPLLPRSPSLQWELCVSRIPERCITGKVLPEADKLVA